MGNLVLGTSAIREHDGLYSLNDLHKASGGLDKHQPAFFLRNEQTKALIDEIQSANLQTALRSINGGTHRGTYACRELVIAYAAWISAAFHLRVIRVFLGSISTPSPSPVRLLVTADAAGTHIAPVAAETIVSGPAELANAIGCCGLTNLQLLAVMGVCAKMLRDSAKSDLRKTRAEKTRVMKSINREISV